MRNLFVHLVLLLVIFTISSANAQAPQKSAANLKPQKTDQAPDSSTLQGSNPAENGGAMGNVYASCRKYFERTFNTQDNFSKKAMCNGYFFGVGSTLLTMQMRGVRFDTMCLPKDISTEKIIEVFLTWAEKNNDKFPIPATQAVFESLAASYPCQ